MFLQLLAAFWLGGIVATIAFLRLEWLRGDGRPVLELARLHPVRAFAGVVVGVLMWPALLQSAMRSVRDSADESED